MFKELEKDCGCAPPDHGDLSHWAAQGVLLLNAHLSVVDSNANAHKNAGWDKITDKIIQVVNLQQQPVVFILWGNHAKAKAPLVNQNRHLLLTGVHPSPLSASRGGFFGCRHFSKANRFLEQKGRGRIDWQLPCVKDLRSAGIYLH